MKEIAREMLGDRLWYTQEGTSLLSLFPTLVGYRFNEATKTKEGFEIFWLESEDSKSLVIYDILAKKWMRCDF